MLTDSVVVGAASPRIVIDMGHRFSVDRHPAGILMAAANLSGPTIAALLIPKPSRWSVAVWAISLSGVYGIPFMRVLLISAN